MIFKCVAMSAQITELGAVLHDFEFEGTDGSSLMIANIVGPVYQLGTLYNIGFDPIVPAQETA